VKKTSADARHIDDNAVLASEAPHRGTPRHSCGRVLIAESGCLNLPRYDTPTHLRETGAGFRVSVCNGHISVKTPVLLTPLCLAVTTTPVTKWHAHKVAYESGLRKLFGFCSPRRTDLRGTFGVK
jgi:hypothetical protein